MKDTPRGYKDISYQGLFMCEECYTMVPESYTNEHYRNWHDNVQMIDWNED